MENDPVATAFGSVMLHGIDESLTVSPPRANLFSREPYGDKIPNKGSCTYPSAICVHPSAWQTTSGNRRQANDLLGC